MLASKMKSASMLWQKVSADILNVTTTSVANHLRERDGVIVIENGSDLKILESTNKVS
jgi:hypothetical protein